MTGELTSLGIDPAAELLYRRVLRGHPADLTSHVQALGWTPEQGQVAYRALVRGGLVADAASGALVSEAPRVAIGRLIEQETARLETRRRELEDARAVVANFASEHQQPRLGAGEPGSIDVVPQQRVVAALELAMRSTSGPIRHCIKSTATVPARDEGLVRWAQAQVAQGRQLRTLYPASFLHGDNVHGLAWLHGWADVGEQQRVLDEVPHAFTVFGEELVLSCTEWGVVTEDLLAIRSPMLVRSFIANFDEAWRVGLPVPHSTYDTVLDDRLLAMLAAGLKDEAIARYLGVSLRTVRRRVAGLMEELGAQTRFQLGSAAERRGLLRLQRE